MPSSQNVYKKMIEPISYCLTFKRRIARASTMLILLDIVQAAVGAYRKAGYTEVQAGSEARGDADAYESSRRCLLMHKTFEDLL